VPLAEVRTPRERPRLLVTPDGSTGSTRLLVWSLQEAARRDATVLAVAVVDDAADAAQRAAARTLLEAQLLHAIGESGVRGRADTALLDRSVYDALAGTACGADLVLVRPHGATVLRPAVPRPPTRRPLIRCA
jgi:hypothetical protein